MKTIFAILFLALALRCQALNFFGWGGGEGGSVDVAAYASSIDNGSGTNVVLDGVFWGGYGGWLGVPDGARHLDVWSYDPQSSVVIGNAYYASGAGFVGTTPNGAYSMLLAPDGFSLSQASINNEINNVLAAGPSINGENAYSVPASSLVGVVPDENLPVTDSTRILETVIWSDWFVSGAGPNNQSPFMSGCFLNRFYSGDNNLFMVNFSRLSKAALATGKTNLVCETWFICTNYVSSITSKITFALMTNNATGPGGQWLVIPDVPNVYTPNVAATNWFRVATTSAIPNVVWSNLAWVGRWSLYNPTPTNCWHGGAKFYLQ